MLYKYKYTYIYTHLHIFFSSFQHLFRVYTPLHTVCTLYVCNICKCVYDYNFYEIFEFSELKHSRSNSRKFSFNGTTLLLLWLISYILLLYIKLFLIPKDITEKKNMKFLVKRKSKSNTNQKYFQPKTNENSCIQ